MTSVYSLDFEVFGSTPQALEENAVRIAEKFFGEGVDLSYAFGPASPYVTAADGTISTWVSECRATLK